ncbi:hypothetical protein Taro_024435 [Colocasia esculenta]|uniref:Protein kinase domain-containing protein n=1 Tax=Colocasia esculenta TaxID=4460 RepID=A0A843V6T5_COLES|nr:hypothetical protein [Colocasia esculenta]
MINWEHGFRIIRGTVLTMFYLHEEWKKLIFHKDIKTMFNLNAKLNDKLEEFGLPQLYDHEAHPRTTNVMGMLRYIAPSYPR